MPVFLTFHFLKQKTLLLCVMMLCFISSSKAQISSRWTTSFDSARVEASRENKFILLNFSGSDWCGPCIKMKNDILTSPVFLKYASDHLILVNADFPRMKKNKQEKPLEEQNEKLADRYDKYGNFPYTLLLNKELKVIKTWDGYPQLTKDEYISPPEEFTSQINEIINAYH